MKVTRWKKCDYGWFLHFVQIVLYLLCSSGSKCNYTFSLVYFFPHIFTRMLVRRQVRINIILLNISNQRAKSHVQVFVATHFWPRLSYQFYTYIFTLHSQCCGPRLLSALYELSFAFPVVSLAYTSLLLVTVLPSLKIPIPSKKKKSYPLILFLFFFFKFTQTYLRPYSLGSVLLYRT